ncbi:MAG: hypothetical protein H6574_16310 [Lewinellaceae bacterium]|nr:hypothetical protein [Saprospiraceae bacterium]MCB9332637.1 hypothetical protein [Lewinellaceae bacterium]
MNTKTIALLCSALLFLLGQSFAQTDKALLHELAQENKKSVDALVLYPEDARLAILEASKYPEVLIKMQSVREKTGAAFRTLIEDFPRNTQEMFFDLSRFPDLIPNLIAHQNDRSAMRRDLDVLPDAKRPDALEVVDRHMATLIRIDALNRTARGAFDQLIAGYPAPAQQAFQTLLGLPEVIDILNEDLRFTVLVGDIYQEDPAWVIRKTDSLNLVVARAQAQELDSWQNTLENDPQARQELQAAAQEYADANGYTYTDEVYDIVQDDLYAEDNAAPEVVYVERYYQYNYPYWFGYPWWAPQPCWRPYPYWWYWGFYPYHSTVVIVQFPSYHFMHWYFDYPRHHHTYNHLSTHFVNHYYGHRNSGSTISMGVGNWRDQNRTIVSDEWLSDKSRLPARLNEYAQFEQQRDKYNVKNPARTLTQEEFLQKNERQYPDLARSRAQAQTEIQRDRAESERQRADWAPARVPEKPTQEPAPARVPQTEPPQRAPVTPPAVPPRVKQPEKNQPAEQPAKRPERPATQPARIPDIDKARDYHREKWQEPKKTVPQARPVPATPSKPRTTPAPKPKTEKPRQAPEPKKRSGGG